jgi:hypothetical protein
MHQLAVLVDQVLARRDRFVTHILGNHEVFGHYGRLTALLIVCAAAYGAVLGMWHGARLAAFDALKLPLVLILTSAITMIFSWMVATALAVPLMFGQVAVLTVLALTTASVLLVSLAPIAWFLTICAPAPSVAARTTHNLLYLMHTAIVGCCGVAGTRALGSGLRRTGHPRERVRLVYALWVLTYAVVGGEVAWAFRPFVGSVSAAHPIVFMRSDALDGNVYEFIGTDILPYLWSRL